MNTQVIYRNDGRGNIQVLPIAQTDMPHADDTQAWDAFYRDLTAQYCPAACATGAFLGKAKAAIYQSVDNIWAVFGFDVRRGLDDHTVRLVRFAYIDSLTGATWLCPSAGQPIAQDPLTARDWVADWTELGSLPIV